MAEIEIELNKTSEERIKRILVRHFGNYIGFRKSDDKNALIVTSTQWSVIDNLRLINSLIIKEERNIENNK